ncbi:hypothetical protein GCM10009603_34500 [Nocardiopsis exhalans]
MAAELHYPSVGEAVEVAGFGGYVSGLGSGVLPFLDAVSEFFGQEGTGGVVGDFLDYQVAGWEGVLLNAGGRQGCSGSGVIPAGSCRQRRVNQ